METTYAHINNHPVKLIMADDGTVWVHGKELAKAIGHKHPSSSLSGFIGRTGVTTRRFNRSGEKHRASRWLTMKDAADFIYNGYLGEPENVALLEDAALRMLIGTESDTALGHTPRHAADRPGAHAATEAQNPALAWINTVLADTKLPYSTQVTALNARRDILEIQATIEKEQTNA